MDFLLRDVAVPMSSLLVSYVARKIRLFSSMQFLNAFSSKIVQQSIQFAFMIELSARGRVFLLNILL